MSLPKARAGAALLAAATAACLTTAVPVTPDAPGPRARPVAAAVPAGAQPHTNAACPEGRPSSPSDFDGDGRAELAVAAPYASAHGRARAGSVRVLYGERAAEDLTQPPGEAELGDAFGSALATGDFDGDSCADLAVGASEEFAGKRVPGADGEGVVRIYHGSPDGLRPGAEIDVTDFGGTRGAGRFGAALAAADLDGDGDDELVIGAPGQGVGGAVGIYGMKGREPYLFTQRTRWVGQRALPTDQFGAAVAAGDFDGDGRAEVAVGAPGDTVLKDGQGSVTIVDPRRRRATTLTQSTPGITGAAEKWDGFGAALAAADFNADGRDDLAIGVPGEGLTGNQRAMDYGDGTVHTIYGSAGGLRPATTESWSQNTLDGKPRYFDRFGAALAAADLDGDGDAELAIGVPGENAVQVIAGTRSGGLTKAGDVLIKGGGGGFGSALAMVPAREAAKNGKAGKDGKGSKGGKGARFDLVVASPGTGRLTLVPGGRGRRGEDASTGVRAGGLRPLPEGASRDLYGYALAAGRSGAG
ncbi:FG-GAP and VCBS repeat-containing protein [Spongiactinospora sp. TRM90649]|uniref:FG-GAP and VCBS repeat-containing protein n=1 Tax=Spongiactinospora sp. TRM90649 TaxID=3031114 RepID=UPI0023F63AEE|nr:FG-GAP and VCBS repeat-containing protein [Spongiactinospora sp. TRM90649]MDF5758270.1 FG-GAP repeat protein [Spongiactinospora sp. TRM90649]